MPLLYVCSSISHMFAYILYFDLQWDDFLKLGNVPEITAGGWMVNKIIKSQKPGQCAQLIYTVS